MKKLPPILLMLSFISLFNHFILAQVVPVPFDSERWTLENASTELVEYLGKESILIKSGKIVLRDAGLLNGTIEFDISFPEQSGFPEVGFRIQDNMNYESCYLRTETSGKPDAVQYTPVFNGSAAWQLYHGQGYTHSLNFNYDTWHHIRIVVKGNKAKIYWDEGEEPVLDINELKRPPEAGSIILGTMMAPIHYADFQYSLSEGGSQSDFTVEEKEDSSIITDWYISQGISRAVFFGKTSIDKNIKNKLIWTDQKSESSGLVNLARYFKPSVESNTIVARFDIQSEREQIKKLRFGFSDEVRVYFNDDLIFFGNDSYLSRDYVFSGLIGYYDALYLPIKKGKNEIWMVVSDNFGGWGVQAKLEDVEGIEYPLDPKILNQYTGEYEVQPGFFLVVTVENNVLIIQPTGQGKIPIYPESPTRFFAKLVETQLEFVKNDKGIFDSLNVYQGNREFTGIRKE